MTTRASLPPSCLRISDGSSLGLQKSRSATLGMVTTLPGGTFLDCRFWRKDSVTVTTLVARRYSPSSTLSSHLVMLGFFITPNSVNTAGQRSRTSITKGTRRERAVRAAASAARNVGELPITTSGRSMCELEIKRAEGRYEI